jgi:hypothetical protein
LTMAHSNRFIVSLRCCQLFANAARDSLPPNKSLDRSAGSVFRNLTD